MFFASERKYLTTSLIWPVVFLTEWNYRYAEIISIGFLLSENYFRPLLINPAANVYIKWKSIRFHVFLLTSFAICPCNEKETQLGFHHGMPYTYHGKRENSKLRATGGRGNFHLQRSKKSILLYLTKLNSNIQHNVSIK